jgi:hypothetical protein
MKIIVNCKYQIVNQKVFECKLFLRDYIFKEES